MPKLHRKFHRGLSSILALALTLWCVATPSLALAQFSPPANLATQSAREYFVGRDLGRPLVSVNLLSGVGQPGVYHVPVGTDIAQLIAFAGGATDRAELDSLTIRRDLGHGEYHITELDLIKALKQPTDLFRIQDQDIIEIKQSLNSERTLQWVSIASAVASIVLSVYLIQSLKH